MHRHFIECSHREMSFCQMSKIQLQVLGNSSLFAHAKVVLSWMNSNKSLFREAVKKLFVFFGIFPKPADPSPPWVLWCEFWPNLGIKMWILCKKQWLPKFYKKFTNTEPPPPYLGNIFLKKSIFTASLRETDTFLSVLPDLSRVNSDQVQLS